MHKGGFFGSPGPFSVCDGYFQDTLKISSLFLRVMACTPLCFQTRRLGTVAYEGECFAKFQLPIFSLKDVKN